MKVYVIKNKQTKEYQTVVRDFIPDIRQSDIFIDYEVALAHCPSDCNVVECELIEKNENADLGKMVEEANTRLCEELELYKRAFNVATMDLDLCRNHYQTLNYELVERVENLRNTILERIKEKMVG